MAAALAIASGKQIRPPLSRVTRSDFFPSNRRSVSAFGSANGIALSFWTNASHSFGGNTNKQASGITPFGQSTKVSTSLSGVRHLAGICTLRFSSTPWR